MSTRSGLNDLPTELLYEVQLYALSDTLPHVSRHIYRVFKHAPVSFHAEYILGRLLEDEPGQIITRALEYPLCTAEVIDALCRCTNSPSLRDDALELPERLFRDLPNRRAEWTERDHPLPFLKHVCHHPSIRAPEIDSYRSYALAKAGEACNLPLIAFLLTYCVLEDKATLLWAAKNGHKGVVKLLLAQDDTDVNVEGRRNRTPLWWAAYLGHEEVVKLLLARDGIDINAKDDRHFTPLRQAAYQGHEGVVRLLMARDDIDVNLTDANGLTPLRWVNGGDSEDSEAVGRDDIGVGSQMLGYASEWPPQDARGRVMVLFQIMVVVAGFMISYFFNFRKEW